MKGNITIDDFAKLDIRVGKIVTAEKIEGSEKLLRLEVDFGEELGQRQIISGIARFYKHEELVNTNRIFIINLEPRSMMGLESQGMILAAGNEDGISTLIPDKEMSQGTEVK